jgi:hypothetical protein
MVRFLLPLLTQFMLVTLGFFHSSFPPSSRDDHSLQHPAVNVTLVSSSYLTLYILIACCRLAKSLMVNSSAITYPCRQKASN